MFPAGHASPDASASSPRTGAYNARVEELRLVHDGLRIVRIRLDNPPTAFEPGQYVTLGLGAWEPTVAGSFAQVEPESRQLIRRPYSISARVVDAGGQPLHPHDDPLWEFYLALVSGTPEHPAQLTPRLFALQSGDRLAVGVHPKGTYTTAPVAPDDDVLFAATGTGEAPHNAMIVHLLTRGHRGRVVSVVGARYRRDFAYEREHRQLAACFPNYHYVTLTTREPENIDPQAPGYVGAQYVQSFVAGGGLEARLGWKLAPERTHIFACGNPRMVGMPLAGQGERQYTAAGGLCELLAARGFVCDRPGRPGNIHFEQYGD